MWASGVVVDEPGVQIGLKRFDGLVECFAHLHPEDLIEDCAVEPLHKSVDLGRVDLRAATPDDVQVQVELIRIGNIPPAEVEEKFHKQCNTFDKGA